jgi:hypothetical protein
MKPFARFLLPVVAVASAVAATGCAAQTGAPDPQGDTEAVAVTPAASGEKPESFICQPSICGVLPDLTVVVDNQPVWKFDPLTGKGYWAIGTGFDVKNNGPGYAGAFTIAVYNGANSQTISLAGMAAGQTEYFNIPWPPCGGSAAVVVNPWETLPESNYNNDSVSVPGPCLY